MFSRLVGALSVTMGKSSTDSWDSLRFEILSLLAVVAFINDDQFELKGFVLIFFVIIQMDQIV